MYPRRRDMLEFLFKSTLSIVTAVFVGQLLRILQHRIKQLPLRNIISPPGGSLLTGPFPHSTSCPMFGHYHKSLEATIRSGICAIF
jgi:hypothetical protein